MQANNMIGRHSKNKRNEYCKTGRKKISPITSWKITYLKNNF